MGKTFHLEIITSDRVFYNGNCEHLVFPAIDGQYGVLAGHDALVTTLNAGELKYLVDGKWKYAAISAGFAEVMPEYTVILADSVELPEEIDRKRAEEAKHRAEELLRNKQSIMDYYHTQAALNRAMNRLKISQKHFRDV